MRVFIALNEGGEEKMRVTAVRCPLCGGRILDVPHGAQVTVCGEGEMEKPDYYVKCWRCKKRISITRAE